LCVTISIREKNWCNKKRMSNNKFEKLSNNINKSSPTTCLTYLEFYSGVGGWTMALEEACHRINDCCKEECVHGNSSLDTTNTVVLETSDTSNQEVTEGKDKETMEQQHHYSLSTPSLQLKRLAAFDHSDVCNLVFQHNFSNAAEKESQPQSQQGIKRKRTKNPKSKPTSIEKLTKKQLETYNATIWTMSPPCQPHTRQHLNQKEDVNDPRSKSFLHLCEMIMCMDEMKLPSVILMENVVRFEQSKSSEIWRKALSSRNYEIGHFHLTPTQVGLPNDRPRYYCVAVGANNKMLVDSDKTCDSVMEENTCSTLLHLESVKNVHQNDDDDVMLPPPAVQTCIPPLNVPDSDSVQEHLNLPSISTFLDTDLGRHGRFLFDENKQVNQSKLSSLRIPDKILSSDTCWCFDIVTSDDRRSACFTSSYGKFVKGTGSVLYTGGCGDESKSLGQDEKLKVVKDDDATSRFKLVPPEQRRFDSEWTKGLNLEENLRYFSGTEVARLMGFSVDEANSDAVQAESGSSTGNFPLSTGRCASKITPMNNSGVKTFEFPSSCTLKQQWKLLGNSLNVRVAARVAEVGLRSLFKIG